MPKTIVFCADGTWSGPQSLKGASDIDQADDSGNLAGVRATNVVKLYSRLLGTPTAETRDLVDEQEKAYSDASGTRQVVKYLHGVGDSRNVIARVLGGAFGAGVIARIVRGYTFISRNYAFGDAIHICGFSRGAYTARALAGMIARVGLLDTSRYDVNDKEEAYKRGAAAWHLSKGLTLTGHSRFATIANHVIDVIESSIARLGLGSHDLVPNIPIKSVAVWDTVGSLGVPLYFRDERTDIFQFTDAKLSNKVERGFHAMAIDEQRADFPVTQWERRAGIDQVWFSGSHSDVGGGFPANESYLSDTTLEWMLNKLDSVGVLLGGSLACSQLDKCLAQVLHTPWKNPPFNVLPQSARQPHIEDAFHSSVIERWKVDAGYRPTSLRFINADNLERLTVG